MKSQKLFTIILNFSDHLIGIGQYESETPENCLKQFINSNKSLGGYDRNLLLNSLMPLIHIADIKGIWSYYFDPELMEIKWPGDNPVLGGHIIQTDINAPKRNEIE